MLQRRGPDAQEAVELAVGCSLLLLRGSLLQLRGATPSKEAILRSKDGSLLCFNGTHSTPFSAPG